METNITVIMIDSRSDIHPDWVSTAINSVKKQYYPVKLAVIDNRALDKTIGKCWNSAVRQCDTEWILLMGDDDWLSSDYTYCLHKFAEAHPEYDAVTTGMTFYNPEMINFVTPQQNTGMWRREYLLKYPFNEKLKKGIDREYVEEAAKRNVNVAHLNYHHGIFVRIHGTHNLTKRPEIIEEPGELYFNARYPTFIRPVVDKLKYQGFDVTLDNKEFNPLMLKNAKLAWCDWADENAYNIAEYRTNIPKILRLHSYEAFTEMIYYINFDKFEKVIFVADHIKEYAETRLKKRIKNAVVIPNGVQIEKFDVDPEKKQNNKIAWAGHIDRKKGAPLLLFIAEHLPDYEFHVAGKFNEEDIIRLFKERAPDNLHLEPYSYNLNDFFRDKTYYLSTSPREGCPVTPLEAMACGVKPAIYKWPGAESYLPPFWTFKDLSELEMILLGEFAPERYRMYVENNYSFNLMYDKIKEIIDVAYKGTVKNKIQDSCESGISSSQPRC